MLTIEIVVQLNNFPVKGKIEVPLSLETQEMTWNTFDVGKGGISKLVVELGSNSQQTREPHIDSSRLQALQLQTDHFRLAAGDQIVNRYEIISFKIEPLRRWWSDIFFFPFYQLMRKRDRLYACQHVGEQAQNRL